MTLIVSLQPPQGIRTMRVRALIEFCTEFRALPVNFDVNTPVDVAVTIRNALTRAKRPSRRSRILLTTLLALTTTIAWAQTQLASVFGTVTDPSGAVVPVASVT